MATEAALAQAWTEEVIPPFENFNTKPTNQGLVNYAHRLERLGRFSRGGAIAQAVATEAISLQHAATKKLELPNGFPTTILSHAYSYTPAAAFLADAYFQQCDELVLRRGRVEISGIPGQKMPGIEFAYFSFYTGNPDRLVRMLIEDPSGLSLVWGINDNEVDRKKREVDYWAHGSKANGEGINRLVSLGAERFTQYNGTLTEQFGPARPLRPW